MNCYSKEHVAQNKSFRNADHQNALVMCALGRSPVYFTALKISVPFYLPKQCPNAQRYLHSTRFPLSTLSVVAIIVVSCPRTWEESVQSWPLLRE